MIDDSHKPGNITCSDVRDLLSDLIDVRRNELPHPDGTRLAESGMRAAVELHLAACDECRDELLILEETGAAFADFSVGEIPVQQFADWGPRVRARMNRGGRVQYSDVKAHQEIGRRKLSLLFVASTLAAASLAFVIASGWMPSFFKKEQPKELSYIKPDGGKKRLPILRAPIDAPTPITVVVPALQPGVQPVTRVFTHDPKEPGALRSLQNDESTHKFLVLGEKTSVDERPLLGVYLRTTRDAERAADQPLETVGLMVYHVVPGSPADMMGLRPNDLIVTVNDAAVASGGVEEAVKFISGIRQAGAGAAVELHIVRQVGGKTLPSINGMPGEKVPPQYLFMSKQGVLGEYRYEPRSVE